MWNSTKDQIKLTLIRHGKTPGNERHAYIGRTDEALSDNGIMELKLKKDYINKAVGMDVSLDEIAVYCSPMKRCQETADILFPGYEKRIVSGFRETDFGDFEGKNYEELSGNPAYQAWVDSNGTLPFPGGESQDQVSDRIKQALEKLLAETFDRKEKLSKLVLVVHGGTIMTILSSLHGGAYYDYQVGNGEGYQCMLTKLDGKYKIHQVEKLL